MLFRSNAAQALTVYDLTDFDNQFRWTESKNEYINECDFIEVDFDVVIESHFTQDFLKGQFSPLDDEAIAWAKPLLELVQEYA